MTVKTFKAAFKAEGNPGDVVARFSVFGMIDDDGDVVEPSFFKDGQEIPIAAWGHDWGSLPVGKGTIKVTPQGAEIHGRFFTETATGKDHYETVKAMGPLQEWSFGFRVLESRKDIFEGQPARFLTLGETYEASPVLIGANRTTSTLDIKAGVTEQDEPVSSEIADQTPTPEKAARQAEARKYMDRWLAQAAFADPLAGSYEALIDDLQDALPAALGTNDPYGYTPAAIVGTFDAYVIAVARVNGDFVWYVLAYTLDADGDVQYGDPVQVEHTFTPAIPIEEKAATYIGHTARIAAALKRYATRSEERAARRAKEGRTLSQANRQMLTTLVDSLAESAQSIRDLLDATEPPAKAAERAAMVAAIEAENLIRRYQLEYA